MISIPQSTVFYNSTVKIFSSGQVEIFVRDNVSHKREGEEVVHKRNSCQDEEKKKIYRYQASIRAGSKIRELIIQNNLVYHWVLTYREDMQDRKEAALDLKNFMKRLRYQMKQKIKFVAVMEIQKARAEKYGVEVIHFHVAVDKFIPFELMRLTWGKGHVWISKETGGDLNRVASYLSKYLKKGLQDDEGLREQSENRYFRSRGLEEAERYNSIVTEQIRAEIESEAVQVAILWGC